MASRFLKTIADRSFPVTISDPLELSAVRKLHDSNFLRVTFVKDALGVNLAVVHEITSLGWTLLKALDQDPC